MIDGEWIKDFDIEKEKIIHIVHPEDMEMGEITIYVGIEVKKV